jgi:hypothetical protein
MSASNATSERKDLGQDGTLGDTGFLAGRPYEIGAFPLEIG